MSLREALREWREEFRRTDAIEQRCMLVELLTSVEDRVQKPRGRRRGAQVAVAVSRDTAGAEMAAQQPPHAIFRSDKNEIWWIDGC